MIITVITLFMSGLLVLGSSTAMAAASTGPQVIPEHEHALASKQHFSGPAETRGIESASLLGSVGLAKDFPSLKGRVLRARELVINPGGVVAVHQHDARPGVAYILEGEIIEHRNDMDKPVVRKRGAVAFEQSGVIHWWENVSNQRVRALVVDIVEESK